ncbi:hypothetical protein L6164_031828 [Bauhinia variegata]|uniref:Uncharacterized protein n=1 Tax=Bauhinia variegata TaxID=167791 RepID=A0ACB9KLV7_BAUVA|nr:hypothetical protein L6164_031828 [Bauhinia variegata]
MKTESEKAEGMAPNKPMIDGSAAPPYGASGGYGVGRSYGGVYGGDGGGEDMEVAAMVKATQVVDMVVVMEEGASGNGWTVDVIFHLIFFSFYLIKLIYF